MGAATGVSGCNRVQLDGSVLIPFPRIIMHLLTMSTGQPHPGARLSTNSTGLQHEQRPSYEIRINGPYVGLLVTTAEDDANILVRNWHTGETLYVSFFFLVCNGLAESLHIKSTESADNRRIASFVFFDASSILIALQSDIVPSDVVSISSQQGPRLEITRFERDQEERWCLLFPQLKDDEDFEAMLLTCEPGPVYVPPRNENAPFHIFDVDENGKGERLIMLNVTLSRSDASLNVAILSSRLRELLYAFRGVNDDTDWVEWQRWGASSTHMVATATAIWEGTWPCITYGTKAIIMRPQGSNNIQVIVQDFSQLRAMWEHKRQDEDHEAYDRLGSPALEVLGGNNGFSAHSWSQRTQQAIFEGTLATQLLYTQLVIPGRISRWDQVMLSGDSIVVVKVSLTVKIHGRKFETLRVSDRMGGGKQIDLMCILFELTRPAAYL